YSPAISQIAYCHGSDLNHWLGKPGNAQHGSCRWRLRFGKGGSENFVHLLILADVLEINLKVDHMVHGQTCGLDNRLDIVECLPNLRGKRRREIAIPTTRSLSRDIYVIAGIYTRRVEMIYPGRAGGRRNGSNLS